MHKFFCLCCLHQPAGEILLNSISLDGTRAQQIKRRASKEQNGANSLLPRLKEESGLRRRRWFSNFASPRRYYLHAGERQTTKAFRPRDANPRWESQLLGSSLIQEAARMSPLQKQVRLAKRGQTKWAPKPRLFRPTIQICFNEHSCKDNVWGDLWPCNHDPFFPSSKSKP